MDVISLHQAGFSQAVATLGTAFTIGHASLIRKYLKNNLMYEETIFHGEPVLWITKPSQTAMEHMTFVGG